MREGHPNLKKEVLATVAYEANRQNEKVKKANERKVYLQLYEAMEALVRKCGSRFAFLLGNKKVVRLLSRKKLGVEIPRNKKDGSFTNEVKAESIKLAMVSEEIDHLRRNVRKMKGLFGDKNKAFLRSSAKLNLSSSSNLLPSCALVKKNMISEFAEALTPL
ncbi:hypothetical protein Tco_1142878 [Tanacetum coccineum]